MLFDTFENLGRMRSFPAVFLSLISFYKIRKTWQLVIHSKKLRVISFRLSPSCLCRVMRCNDRYRLQIFTLLSPEFRPGFLMEPMGTDVLTSKAPCAIEFLVIARHVFCVPSVYCCSLAGLLFSSEDVGDIFLRNVY